MKILLVYPPVTLHRNDANPSSKSALIGLGYIAAMLEKNKYDVKILDCIPNSDYRITINKDYKRSGLSDIDIKKQIIDFDPEIVGVSCMYTSYLHDAHNIAHLSKECDKNIFVVFGGSHASTFPNEVMKDNNVDCVVIGEGDYTMPEIADRIDKNQTLSGINGIFHRSNKKIIKENPRDFIINLDELPFPAWHLLDKDILMNESVKSPFPIRPPAGPMITSRGCPGDCYFCSVKKMFGRRWRKRSPNNIVDEIEFLQKEGFREIHFIDDNFSANASRVNKICDEILRRRINIKWTTPTGIAYWTLNEKLLKKMKKSGCYRLTFGIESGDEYTRKVIKKTYSLNKAKEVISYSNKIGLWTAATFILGFPHENKDQIERTINVSKWLGLDFAVFYLLNPQPGTEVYDIFKEQNLFNLDKYLDPNIPDEGKLGSMYGSGVATNNFQREELQGFLSTAYSSFLKYRASRIIKNPFQIIRKVHSTEDFIYLLSMGKVMFGMLNRLISVGKFNNEMVRGTNKSDRYKDAFYSKE